MHFDDDNNDNDDDNDDDDDEHNGEDQNGHNSDNFQARKSRFCMVIDLNNTQRILLMKMLIMMIMMIIMMMMMNMMMKIKIAITWPIFKLGGPDFVWYKISIIPKN